MSQQTLPCTSSPELPRVGSFFPHKCLVFPKKCPKKKPEYVGVIQVKRPKNVFFSAYSLKPNFNKLNIFR